MNKHEKRFEDLMEKLYEVPTVSDHMKKFEVQMAQKIRLRRAELGLTQSDLVKLVKADGDSITQKTISKVESGEHTIESETYEKILKALGINGGYEVELRFNEEAAATVIG